MEMTIAQSPSTKYKLVRDVYFEPTEASKLLSQFRKKSVVVTIDKVDGSERQMEGFLCFREDKGQWLINTNLDSITEVEFRVVSSTRLKSVIFDGKKYLPKRKKIKQGEQDAI